VLPRLKEAAAADVNARTDNVGSSSTLSFLMTQYGGLAVIPLDAICRDYFRHLSVDKFLRKVLAGEISLPIVRIESSQKAAKGVHVADLAEYLDRQREAARKECDQLRSAA
jgi:Pyocin activator protein PrtN